TFLGGPPGKTVDYAKASPITCVSKDAAPTLLLHGSADKKVPVGQSRRYAQKMRDAGATVELLVLEGAPHGFEKEPEIHANAVTFDFLDRHLKEARHP